MNLATTFKSWSLSRFQKILSVYFKRLVKLGSIYHATITKQQSKHCIYFYGEVNFFCSKAYSFNFLNAKEVLSIDYLRKDQTINELYYADF